MNVASDGCKWDLEYFPWAYCIYLDRRLSKRDSGCISCEITHQAPVTFYYPDILNFYFAQFFSTDPK